MKFFKIGKPLKIGNMEIRNRMVIPAMHLGDADEGFVSENIIEFYRRRAEGGFGFIIVGGLGVSKRGQGVPAMISIDDDKYIPRLLQLTTAIHKEGAKVCAQLYHAGAYSMSKITGEQPVSASAIYSRFSHETPRELSTEEVGEVQDKIVAYITIAYLIEFPEFDEGPFLKEEQNLINSIARQVSALIERKQAEEKLEPMP